MNKIISPQFNVAGAVLDTIAYKDQLIAKRGIEASNYKDILQQFMEKFEDNPKAKNLIEKAQETIDFHDAN